MNKQYIGIVEGMFTLRHFKWKQFQKEYISIIIHKTFNKVIQYVKVFNIVTSDG